MPDHHRPPATVRDHTLRLLRELGLTTVFANPGSTEVPFLVDLPDDIDFVLGLHEGSVVGMATGWALARERPALVQLHTTAGLGNAVGALATARVNRAPLVVLVGQQDRRHLAHEPFLAGHLEGLAGDYPVAVHQPVRAQDVPGAVARAHHEAVQGRGPVLVVVCMDDWARPMDPDQPRAAPARVARPLHVAPDDAAATEIAAFLDGARSPALVVGAGADSAPAWRALTDLAERLRAPVFQESFGARAGFPQDHPLFAGHLPAERSRLRAALRGHDAVLVVGAPALRQYIYADGPLVDPGTRLAMVGDDDGEAHRGAADLAVIAPVAAFTAAVAALVDDRTNAPAPTRSGPAAGPDREVPAPPAEGEPLRPAHVLAALAARVGPDTAVVEETPSSRPRLHRLLPARAPLGFLSAAMGGLGFALPAATGLRMAAPTRPVVAVVGDGSALYQVQALWSAARYRVGVLFVVLSNGRYAVMDRLAEHGGGKAPWPDFPEVSLAALARGLGCPAVEVATHTELCRALDEATAGLAERETPLLLDVTVAPDPDFAP
ncbi:thiamine pyrophosphate-dependent enzyme [Nocardiopsis aegyptia]|uniref:Benzoylformate decarboxylase n=1 Tax=Nocardiopsis aegyptia TaxID=220378 RepID=A0A7Z0ETW6_9ACTN|nr:thiamine pyrophosphate-dependent enzyme [Nocardiopsis aegyptia]NYJ38210.1 benzoylformate decarboxylase [Nocardiopsis aegyptia]